jgi:hypothetical protein
MLQLSKFGYLWNKCETIQQTDPLSLVVLPFCGLGHAFVLKVPFTCLDICLVTAELDDSNPIVYMFAY